MQSANRNGTKILQLRLMRNMTQQQVANAVGIGLRTYRRYERFELCEREYANVRVDARRILTCIAQFFGVSVDELLSGCKTDQPEHLKSEPSRDVVRLSKQSEVETCPDCGRPVLVSGIGR